MKDLLTESEYLQIYNEALAHSPEVKLIDKEFGKLMDMIEIIDNGKGGKKLKTFRNNKDWGKCFDALETLTDKMFNTDCTFYLDTRPNIEYCACILLTPQDYKKIAEEIMENGEGYYFKTIRKTTIYFQEALFLFMKYYKMDARILTAILLHEIGHKVFLKVNTEIERKDNKVNLIFTLGIGVSFIITYGGIAAALPIPALIGLVLTILIYILWVFYANKNGMYIDTESNCDSMAVKYGYSTEIFSFFSILVEVFVGKGGHVKVTNKRYQYETSLNRLENIKKNIRIQMDDKTTSKEDKEFLKKQLDEINNIEKKRLDGELSSTIQGLINSPDKNSKFNNLINKLFKGRTPATSTLSYIKEETTPFDIEIELDEILEELLV